MSIVNIGYVDFFGTPDTLQNRRAKPPRFDADDPVSSRHLVK